MDAREVIRAAVAEAFGPAFGPPEHLERIAKRHERALDAHTDKIIAALAANQLAVVGRKPTEAMISQFGVEGSLMRLNAKNIWRAMFDAISPSPVSTGDRR